MGVSAFMRLLISHESFRWNFHRIKDGDDFTTEIKPKVMSSSVQGVAYKIIFRDLLPAGTKMFKSRHFVCLTHAKLGSKAWQLVQSSSFLLMSFICLFNEIKFLRTDQYVRPVKKRGFPSEVILIKYSAAIQCALCAKTFSRKARGLYSCLLHTLVLFMFPVFHEQYAGKLHVPCFPRTIRSGYLAKHGQSKTAVVIELMSMHADWQLSSSFPTPQSTQDTSNSKEEKVGKLYFCKFLNFFTLP